MKEDILIANRLLPALPSPDSSDGDQASQNEIGTVLANFAYYGIVPDHPLLCRLGALSSESLGRYWASVNPAIERLTGDDRKMDQFVVYKNFPKEVLDLSHAQYWINQIFMYLGAPADWFREEEVVREPLSDDLELTVFREASENSLPAIYDHLIKSNVGWTDSEFLHAKYLMNTNTDQLDLGNFGFKENGIHLIAHQMLFCKKQPPLPIISDATDVLRLAGAVSNDGTLPSGKMAFSRFSRKTRRVFLSILEQCQNLDEDFSRRSSEWKRLLRCLHPGDYQVPNVQSAYDRLYRGDYKSFSQKVEGLMAKKDPRVLDILSSRPGEFARLSHKLYELFGCSAITQLLSILDQLETGQILSLRRYFQTVNHRDSFIRRPQGDWSRFQIAKNNKCLVAGSEIRRIEDASSEILRNRLNESFPSGVDLDIGSDKVKLPMRDQSLAKYGRGTCFKIPDSVTFVRTASFWSSAKDQNIWYDNGFLFFGENWDFVDSCTWDHVDPEDDMAVFSGDPTTSKDPERKGCQMIDLHLDRLQDNGVRYALWSVLCFSKDPFSDASEVLATLQWGEDSQSGQLYEPKRAQMVFPLVRNTYTNYVAYIDLKTRELVYLDIDFGGAVHSMGTESNIRRMEQAMPAVVEHLDAQPSVYDLFQSAREGDSPVLYTDREYTLEGRNKGFVFHPVNPENTIDQVDLTKLL